LAATPWLLFARRQKRRTWALAMTAVGLWLAWTFHSRLPRFFLPSLPVLALASACALFQGLEPGWPRRLALSAVGTGFLFGMSASIGSWFAQGLWRVPLGLQSRPAYLGHRQPAYPRPPFPAIDFINRNAPQDALVLFVGEERSFYLERRAIAASAFDRPPLLELAEASSDGKELSAKLRALGVTYLLINRASPRFKTLLERLSPRGLSACRELADMGKVVFEEKRETEGDLAWLQVLELPR
jgi:hypothetical protein